MRALDESEAKNLLASHNIPTTNFAVVNSIEELNKINLRFPLVMKVCSSKIMHKTDVGGVILNIANEKQMKESFKKMKEKFPKEKILVEEMEKQGTEMIVGIHSDDFFGKIIMVGMGGIYTELYKDVSFRKIPISKRDAENMLQELIAYKLFEGFRNIKLDKEAMVDLLLRVSSIKGIHQMDLNPVFVYKNGLKVVDAKVILE